ncbi:DUF3772 domain-containing protein [Tropicimonas sp. IMCC34043]|uniref:DUF3772 domain-containing protein n=1 Tax=Tropicimonas sp. IMCC34043 TaxID=2248760 RepID=UPI0018E54A41|nr:DUF3772 domain-containing protein [Tropicimonas sp. IMCC34043]
MARIAVWLRILLIAVAVTTSGFCLPVHAADELTTGQDEPADFDAWEKTAIRAEQSLSDAKASDAAFEQLRADLVVWRAKLQKAEQQNASRIATLEGQIAALGPPPTDGETEDEELAARRAELQKQYQDLIAPVRIANEALARANGMISDLDTLLRERQRSQLLQRGPSPLNPMNLRKGIGDLAGLARVLVNETTSAMNLRSERVLLRQNLPVIGVLVFLAVLFLWRGRLWFERAAQWMINRGRGSERGIVGAMLMSLGQVVVPFIGVFLLTAALLATSMFGARGVELVQLIPSMGLSVFLARWLGGQTFPYDSNWPSMFDLTFKERRRGRFYFMALGILFALFLVVQNLSKLFILEHATEVILRIPLVLLSAICLWGLSGLLISHADKSLVPSGATEEGARPTGRDETVPVSAERSFIDGVYHLIGRAGRIFAIAGPVVAMLGYSQAGIYLTLSPALSLALLALINFLQRLSTRLFNLFLPSSRDGDSLWPVLFNVLIVLSAVPLLAVIWGVRQADLAEIWLKLQDGVELGGTKVSLSAAFSLLVIFLIGYSVTKLLQGVMRTSILPRTRLDPGAQSAVNSGVGYLGISIAGLVAVSVAGLNLSSLAFVAGALSVGVGFGLQNIVSNFVSGLILLMERPVSEGDWVEVGGVMGTVRKISVRATTVETFDRTDVIVPNSDFITSQVTNWTRGNLTGRLILTVGVAYGSDTRKVAEILQEIAEAHPLVIVNPPPLIVFQGFGDNSLDFEMRVILRDINFGLGTRTELNHRIAERFAEAGIEIPFPQRDIWVRNAEALRPRPGVAAPAGITATAPVAPDSMPELPASGDAVANLSPEDET